MITPEQIDLAWLMANRRTVADALNFVEALKRADVQLGGAGASTGLIWNGSDRVTIIVPARLPEISGAGTDSQRIEEIITALRASRL